MSLFNWGGLSNKQLDLQRRMEEEAFIEEALRHRLHRPISADVEVIVTDAGDSSGDGGEGMGYSGEGEGGDGGSNSPVS